MLAGFVVSMVSIPGDLILSSRRAEGAWNPKKIEVIGVATKAILLFKSSAFI